MSTNAGFTLIEVLVAVAIVGILSGVGFWGSSGYRQQLRLNNATQTVATTLREVGERAASTSQGMNLSVTSHTLSWRSVGESDQRQLELPNRASVTLSGGGDIVYSGRGLPIQRYDLTLKLGDKTRSLYLQPTGQVFTP